MMKILCVVGVRPNFVKLAGLIDALSDFELLIVHTGQHYTPGLSKEIWDDLRLPRPGINLRVCSGSHVHQLTTTMSRLEPVIKNFEPDAVLVVGDANPTLAGALAANKMGVDVIHVEAGLRSFDRSMPEEINRIIVDNISRLLFVTEPSGMTNLACEKVPGKAHLVGNVMLDAMRKNQDRINASDMLECMDDSDYVLCTLHRPSNVDDAKRMVQIARELLRINKDCLVIILRHPRVTWTVLTAYQPAKYTDFIKLLTNAKMVITDSGGVQEEALAVQTPCLTLRASTERPITLEGGANLLVEPETLYVAFQRTLKMQIKFKLPELWDGHAAERIATIIKEEYKCSQT